MALTTNDLPEMKRFYIDDYLGRSEKTVLNSLKKDKDNLSSDDLKQLLEKETMIKMRQKIIIFLKSLLEKRVGLKPVEEEMKKDKVNKTEKFLAVWKIDNVTDGLTIMSLRKNPLTFYKGMPVEINKDEKIILESKYPNNFLIKIKEEFIKCHT